ncbi:MAG TPA: hypothetical protein PLZ51_25160, partial [Aggregatilineales bacterium]|nr:hypothetical protein [Aggregatilineales bacterium]
MENTLSTSQTTPSPQKGTWHVSIWAGIFIGGLFTLPLITFLFLADNLLGLPFLPFDVFSFVRDLIPGAILTFGIDSMIAVIRIFGLDLDTSAKLAEQAMAIGMVVVIGSIVGGIIYASINRLKRDSVTIGAILGVALGTAMALIVAGKNITATANPIASLF